MRSLSCLVGVAMLGACGGTPPPDGLLAHESTLTVHSSGVALFSDVDLARVGMLGVTCDVYTEVAEIGADYDYPGDSDTVLDVLGADVLVSSESGLWVEAAAGQIWIDGTVGVIDGAFTDEAVVALVDDFVAGCLVRWQGDDVTVTHVDYDACADATSFTADAATGAVWIGTPRGVYAVTPEGSERMRADAGRVAWDASTGLLYAADAGDTVVRALDRSGTEHWSTPTSGAVVDVVAVGDTARVAVALALDDDTGAMAFLDGRTGDLLGEQPIPAAPDRLSVSDDGARMALVHPGSIGFFDLGAR